MRVINILNVIKLLGEYSFELSLYPSI